ncbi:MAG: hypothetical protein K2J20_01055 [Bacilli bacterium]|nr:hypothetical protein [Bacilli bacterium]
MFKKTKSFSLKEFWERKLNIKYDIEIEYYKRFCGVSYKYKLLLKNTDLYNASEDITYDNWKKHILKTIENLSIKELREYSRFLNQENVSRNFAFGFWQSLIIPYIVMMISTYTTMAVPIFGNYYNEVAYSFFIIMWLLGIILIFKKLLGSIIESKTQNFYQDIKEIVDEYIKETNQ